MNIYIAASWKHEHAVRLLTEKLRPEHEVWSFVEKAGRDEVLAKNPKRETLDEWVMSPRGRDKFRWDVKCATEADLVIYIGPSGTDAWAEVGAAWSAGVVVYALYGKGEQAGLMRRMATWFPDHMTLMGAIAGDENVLCHQVGIARNGQAILLPE